MDDNSAPVWGRNLPGELQDKWPKNDGGDYEAPAFLTRRSAVDMDDELLFPSIPQQRQTGSGDSWHGGRRRGYIRARVNA